jgi:RND family efflux transporter MFP subunit
MALVLKWIPLIAALSSAAVVSGNAFAEARSSYSEPKQVRTARVELHEPLRKLRFSGITRAVERAALSFTVGGRLAERESRLGSRVSKGDILARLDPAPLENAVLEADAALSKVNIQWRQARRERERMERLYQVGGRTQRDLEDAQAMEGASRVLVLAAQSRLEEAERLLDEASLRSPFSGVISEVLLEPGEFANPGTPILVVSGNTGFEVVAQVPEAIVTQLRLGAPVSTRFPMSQVDPVEGRVRSITYVGLRTGALFPVVVRLGTQDGVMAGMSAEVIFGKRQKRSLLVPINAVINPTGEQSTVFRIRNGRAHKVDVDVIELIGDRVIVQGQLEVDDEIIVSGQTALLNGDPVNTERPASPANP